MIDVSLSRWGLKAPAATTNFSFSSIAKAIQSEGLQRAAASEIRNLGALMILTSSAPNLGAWWIELIETIIHSIGHPIIVFANSPKPWREIDVNTNRPKNSSRGIGRQPMHIDFVNASNPPDYTVLSCIRPDPLNGGRTLLANIEELLTELDQKTLSILSEKKFVDGKFIDLLNIGHDCNPFPIYNKGPESFFRYTEKILGNCQDVKLVPALMDLQAAVAKHTISVKLPRGASIILDQKKWLHGRTSLGEGQEQISTQVRRLLLQCLVRKECSDCEKH